ncbi:haloacetate dehalogenase [Leeuwenhoekiella aestuarii]|uniref:Haloacetate dehalogenase n=1 Tax=Leeuwenhoekiella aestuarii TaxID=2249426 RepID=A0A4Q0NPG1_9FLAO|nr:alpha/beta hydrolase [Leeuwenhoekiella aestuarii]RXG11988.1 haloacetate dehalogenase [Leeuwenhoekiella aestuarii]RXG13546.1 haloacetate dehalogenase [Leeuwenhoekiella aestuarii]
MIFKAFKNHIKQVNGVEINYVIGGSGPPLLLLHGYPQTYCIWHKIADQLANAFTVVASDLRGYGDSGNPPTEADHSPYSKREMGKDQILLMQSLGFDQFYLAGHDRGGRVGHRMALDYPEVILKMAVLDIAPTYTMYKTTDMGFAKAYYHWFFLIQPYDIPEKMIGADPEYFLNKKLGQWGRDETAITKEARQHYLRCFTPETIHSSCEDYRASATIDLELDQFDIDTGKKLVCPVLCLWGEKAFVGRKYNVIEEWKIWSDDVTGLGLPCGHYLPEEAPAETTNALINFFKPLKPKN